MRFDWRASGVAATAALVLSLFSGILGGVAFGALIVRAAIGAVVFGAGAAGVSYVIDRYLPDLKQSMKRGGTPTGGSAEPSAEAEGTSGGQVDIVVDDEVDTAGLAASDFELEEAEEPAAAAPDELPEAGEDTVAELEADEEAEEAQGVSAPDSGAVQAEQAAAESGFTPGLSAEQVHTGGADDGIGELEEADAESPDEVPETASSGSLPDIEGFSGDFSEAPLGDSDDEETSEGSGEDPEIMARAIRTVLKREE